MAEVITANGLAIGLVVEPEKADKPEEKPQEAPEQAAKKKVGRPKKDQ